MLERIFGHYKTSIGGLIAIAIGLLMLKYFPDADVKPLALILITAGIGALGLKDPKKNSDSNNTSS